MAEDLDVHGASLRGGTDTRLRSRPPWWSSGARDGKARVALPSASRGRALRSAWRRAKLRVAEIGDQKTGALPRGQSSPVGGQRVTYLQSRFATDPLTAHLLPRLRDFVIRADAQSDWRRVHAPTLVPRTIELLNYTSSAQHADASLSLGWQE